MRNVLIGPFPGRMFPDTFQLPPVSPTFCTGTLWKVTTLPSKMKSPWNPTSLFFASMVEVLTAAMKLLLDESTAGFGKRYRYYRSSNLTGTRTITWRSCDGPSRRSTKLEAVSPKTSAS